MEISQENKYKITNIIWVIDMLSMSDHPQDKRKARNAYNELSDFVKIVEAAQQSVQPTASGVGKRGNFANLLVSLGKYLVKLGGGDRISSFDIQDKH